VQQRAELRREREALKVENRKLRALIESGAPGASRVRDFLERLFADDPARPDEARQGA
jgi:hypothetical protein